MNTPDSWKVLLDKYLKGTINRDELERLLNLSLETADDAEKTRAIQQFWDSIQVDIDAGKVLMDSRFRKIVNHTEENEPRKTERKSYTLFRRFAAAAVLISIVSLSWYVFTYEKGSRPEILKQTDPVVNDVLPGGNKALLTLSDGTVIELDSAGSGFVASQGNSKIVKSTGGQLEYVLSGNSGAGEIFYNTIRTPRGGQYHITLPDGSRVWLNSASSLRFPAEFSNQERRVELTGEAYFEVAKLSGNPFFVKVNDIQVEVLGTHFNVMAYGDEETIATTLIEGSVNVSRNNKSLRILPGQQILSDEKGELVLNKAADVEMVMAWKNGYFHFNNTSLQSVMRQLARWYDIDVVYEGIIPQRLFGGQISKNLKITQVLRILEESNIHFKVEGKRLIVTY